MFRAVPDLFVRNAWQDSILPLSAKSIKGWDADDSTAIEKEGIANGIAFSND